MKTAFLKNQFSKEKRLRITKIKITCVGDIKHNILLCLTVIITSSFFCVKENIVLTTGLP